MKINSVLIDNISEKVLPNNNSFLKCPFNYIGGKHKILPQLYANFPEKMSLMVDVFGGGFNVGINSNADKVIYNDQITPLVELFKYFQNNKIEDILNYIDDTIKKFNIKKNTKEGFLDFRKEYNHGTERNPLDLYVLICFSFNYQIRFNNSGKFNCPHGTNRSCFTKNMKTRLINFIDKLHEKDVEFLNHDFKELNYEKLDDKSFVYCDPPYLITTGSYNDGNRGFKNWTEKEEKELLNLLSHLDNTNIKFALSNVIEHKGHSNNILKEWSKNYETIYLDNDYSNSCYNTKRKNSQEVLIVNY